MDNFIRQMKQQSRKCAVEINIGDRKRGESMQIVYQPELLEFMEQEKKHTIVVETVLINHSEFEIMELHVHLIHDKQADHFRKKRYRSLPTEHGEVLLPPYKLHFQDTVTFGLKKFLFLRMVTYQGITQ